MMAITTRSSMRVNAARFRNGEGCGEIIVEWVAPTVGAAGTSSGRSVEVRKPARAFWEPPDPGLRPGTAPAIGGSGSGDVGRFPP